MQIRCAASAVNGDAGDGHLRPPPFAYRHIAAQESDVEHHDRTPARAFGVRGGRCRGLFLEQDRKI